MLSAIYRLHTTLGQRGIIISTTQQTMAPLASDYVPPADPIELVAIDVDGTLLRSDKKLTRKTALVIAEATHNGINIVLASARPPRSVREIYKYLKLKTPTIHYNGALVHDLPAKKNIFHQPLTSKLARRIIKFARRIDPDVIVSVEILDKWYTDHFNNDLAGQLPTETSLRSWPSNVSLFAPRFRSSPR